MKRLLLTSASLLALLAAAPTASATTFLFTGAIVDFPVPVAGTYQIIAFGAQGGGSGAGTGLVHGGGGAEIRGDFVLMKGECWRSRSEAMGARARRAAAEAAAGAALSSAPA